ARVLDESEAHARTAQAGRGDGTWLVLGAASVPGNRAGVGRLAALTYAGAAARGCGVGAGGRGAGCGGGGPAAGGPAQGPGGGGRGSVTSPPTPAWRHRRSWTQIPPRRW